jgi:hypothetical protein
MRIGIPGVSGAGRKKIMQECRAKIKNNEVVSGTMRAWGFAMHSAGHCTIYEYHCSIGAISAVRTACLKPNFILSLPVSLSFLVPY